MTTKQVRTEINKVAKKHKANLAFAKKDVEAVVVEFQIPSLVVTFSDKEYFFQGEEAGNMLEEAVATANKFQTPLEDTILWMFWIAQGW